MSDTPTHVSLTLAQLDKELGEPPAPYVFALADSTRVTFPNPGIMEALEAEQMLVDFASSSGRATEILGRWLDAEDLERLLAARLSFRQMSGLLEHVLAYYKDVFGSPGESDASES